MKDDLIYCEKCHKTLKRSEFYQSNNLEKYPNEGTVPICKKCLTMHVDNWNPETYLWILQEMDVPYIPEEWNKLLASYGGKGKKVTGTTILGRYLSKMKLNQYRKWRWADTAYLQELDHKKVREALEANGATQQEIDKAIRERSFEVPTGELREPGIPVAINDSPQTFAEPLAFEQHVESAEELGLTEDDVIYLKLRWGSSYKPSEWVWLEQYYADFEESYDIQSAGHKDTLKKLAKTSLKLDQLIDLGDIEGAQKTQRMYDSLMKSGRFTAAQNKAESGEAVDSISELVMLCESDGFIPRYYIDTPKDKVDRVIQDLKEYTHSLITEETNIGNLIENAVKQIEVDREKEARTDADAATDDELLEDALFNDDLEYVSDNEFAKFTDFEKDLAEEDEKALAELLEN